MEVTGRRARAIEYAGKYVDVAVRRWQAITGKEAIHAETDRSFESSEEALALPRESSARAA